MLEIICVTYIPGIYKETIKGNVLYAIKLIFVLTLTFRPRFAAIDLECLRSFSRGLLIVAQYPKNCPCLTHQVTYYSISITHVYEQKSRYVIFRNRTFNPFYRFENYFQIQQTSIIRKVYSYQYKFQQIYKITFRTYIYC